MSKTKIAIVGFAARLPGGALADLWSNLCSGRDLVTEIAGDRWNVESYLHPDRSHAGSFYTKRAGNIGDISGFDAAFFGISPREAEQMDPQQRVLLELGWEAFEDAGIPPSRVRGSQGGVFIGFSGSDWSYRRADDLASFDANSMTGQTGSVAANRLSYQFDLRGPSFAVDTACSSSLVAFHQACAAIERGECDLALAGGIALHLHPFAFVGFSRASMLSPRGVCNVFDADGDGYVRSEGGGLFLLKPLDSAIADGDRIHAVVAGSGVNCDGRTQGITVPGADAQAELLERVYRDAGIKPSQLDYVEAHGTGTAVGDPIECRSLGTQLGSSRSASSPLLIGSVKSNMGHLETASGVAGLAKALLCLRHRAVPPTIGLKTPNPHIDFDGWNLKVATERTPLDTEGTLTIGVNSFGFGGANAHVILQSAPEPGVARYEGLSGDDGLHAVVPLLLSGRDTDAVAEAAAQMADHLDGIDNDRYYDMAFTAAVRREWLQHRLLAFAPDLATLKTELREFADGRQPAHIVVGEPLADASAPVFVYSGNGSQWAGMGCELLQQSVLFAAAVKEVDEIFQSYGDFSIVDVLRADDAEERLAATEVAQPALFAIQVGLTRMLQSTGCTPAAVVGHSVGEVAAAWACGALTLRQAIQVIYERSLHQGSTRGTGQMTAVGISAEGINGILAQAGLERTVALAGINSPRGVTVAGPPEALAELEAELAEREIFYRRLALDYAFHSEAMDPIEKVLKRDLAMLAPGAGDIPFYSTVTGAHLPGADLDNGYWWRNIREPVLFEQAVNALIGDGYNLFVEIGPHAVLRTYVNDCLREQGSTGRVVTTLQRGNGDLSLVLAAYYQTVLAVQHADVAQLFPRPGNNAELPHYPWQRKRYWYPTSSEGYEPFNRVLEHRLLGYRMHENPGQWENLFDLAVFPDLADHAVGDTVVFPAAGFVEMALAAASAWYRSEPADAANGDAGFAAQEIEELEILSPLLLEKTTSRKVRFSIEPGDGRFTIRSRGYLEDGGWQLHVVGRLPGKPTGGTDRRPLHPPQRVADSGAEQHYALTAGVGLDYGPAYRAVGRIWFQGRQVIAQLQRPAEPVAALETELLHPAVLDGCFQLLVDLLRAEIGSAGGVAFVPVKIGRLRQFRSGRAISLARAAITGRGARSVVADFELFDDQGRCVALVEGARFRGVILRRGVVDHTGYLKFDVVPKPLDANRLAVVAADSNLPNVCRETLHAQDRLVARAPFYDEIEPLIDVLCAAFALEALRELTGEASGIDADELVLSGRVAQRQAVYLRQLIDILRDDGLLEESEQGLAWSSDQELPSAASIWTSLLGDYPDYAAEILLLGRVGKHLVDVLRGDRPAEDLVPADADHPMIAHYLRGSPSLSSGNRALADMVRSAAKKLKPGERLRVLEFTLGHSQLAAQVLPELDFDCCDYVVATNNAQVFESMGLLLEHYPRVDTLLLDAGDGATVPERFDIVLVAHELSHATYPERLLATLTERLLPGGILALAEQPVSRWQRLVFGLRESWWQAQGDGFVPNARPAHGWLTALQRLGLADVALVHDMPTHTDGAYLLCARSSRAQERPAIDDRDADGCWLILHDSAGPGRVLAELLAAGLRSLDVSTCLAGVGETLTFDAATADEGGMPVDRYLAEMRSQRGVPQGIVVMHDLPFGPTDPMAAGRRCIDAAALCNACVDSGVAPAILFVTSGATGDLVPGAPAAPVDDATLWGFTRTLMNEFDALGIRLVELADPHDPEATSKALVDEICHADGEDEVIYSPLGRYCPRLHTVRPASLLGAGEAPGQSGREVACLDFRQPGPLKNLQWSRKSLPEVGSGDVEIEVRAAGLNFRDVMYAMGLLSDEAVENGFAGATLGMELSGVVTAVGDQADGIAVGDEVIAFAPASFAERVVTPVSAVARKPANWSFPAAATVPTTFFTAYYALHHLARIEEGERLLIHGAAGGVGLAAMQIARAAGVEVFATVGSEVKRDVVRLLGADHVLDSRSLAFADDILDLTGGEGVDVVLNSLAGEAINRNLRVLRPFGRFLELGKRDFYENTRIGLRPFRNNISYFGIDADQLMAERPALTRRVFTELMRLFEHGELKPLPYRLFPAAQAVEAFRFMQQSRQIGKVVLGFDEGVGSIEQAAPDHGALTLDADATYLVTGGMRGFGLATAVWLAGRGARHLVLLSRRGAADDEAASAIESLQKQGVRVRAVACDVTDLAALRATFEQVRQTMPPLRGIVHAAMVIDDGLVRGLDATRIRNVLAPKIDGARHLDLLSRDLELDFFVLYSSATTLFGNPGQASYVAANRFLEVLANARRSAGLPATCISWGAIDDVGYLARNSKIKEQLQSRLGGSALQSAEALAALEQLLVHDLSGVGVMELDWATLQRSLPSSVSPKYADLVQEAEDAGADADGAEQLQRWLEELDDDALAAAIAEVLKREVGEILHVAPEKIEDGKSLHDIGMDSLMGMELVAAVETRFGVTLPLMALSEGLTIERLVQTMIRQLRSTDGEAGDDQSAVQRLAAQHGSGADADAVDAVTQELQSKAAQSKSLMDDR
ncbi:MAG: SDR family NAD(P)-dependent oxidoreductase [Gammaproteobacteria bacterium]|nr:SDR family NAD(P)-dependent oxidoreductase [Gammaproteobacteria bacterium]